MPFRFLLLQREWDFFPRLAFSCDRRSELLVEWTTRIVDFVPARYGKAIPVSAGQTLTIISKEGSQVLDLWALDRSRLFPGRFHVLGGRLSALEGVRPEDLGIDKLVSRVAAGGIDEVVLAMNATLEGQTTAHYLAERLERFPVRITQLAHGLPVGGELDYLDEGTLAQAMRARRPVA